MDIQALLEKFNSYGPIVIFWLLYLESLNLSGIPATIIMPAIGFFIAESQYSFGYIFLIAVIAGVIGNLTYYFIAYKFGAKIYDKVYSKFPKTQNSLNKAKAMSEKYDKKACLIGRLIPGVRGFITLISGIFSIEPRTFAVYSLAGIIIWDFVTIFSGYFIAVYL
ncbi:DedA family protein [Cellulosilyticum sp. I15G10I2]|uniref:DedA family protein n=1 Tax=Cellulosilyticum sp. I15G10I2 TaxID=1892843 RepID=UPI00085C210F|nr:DedA family protein [Cellulosilyticum sp. I15G10I2]